MGVGRLSGRQSSTSMTSRSVTRSPARKAKFRRESKPTNSHPSRSERTLPSDRGGKLTNVLVLAALTAFPIARVPKLWAMLWLADRPRAWDGTGHYGIAQVYDQTIFPDTFGWTHAYFGGTAPLFLVLLYSTLSPPLFCCCVAFLHHMHLFSFTTAFKLLLALSVLLLPAGLWPR